MKIDFLNNNFYTDYFDFDNDNFSKGVKYTLFSTLFLSIWGGFYYFGVCDFDKELASSCGTSLESFKINLGLPLLAGGALLKAQDAFRKSFQS